MPCEGESGGSTPSIGQIGSDDITRNLKRKRNELEGNVDINEPRKTCGIRTDYRHLHDPFPDEEEEENFLTNEEIIAGYELTSLKDTKDSLEWPEWK